MYSTRVEVFGEEKPRVGVFVSVRQCSLLL